MGLRSPTYQDAQTATELALAPVQPYLPSRGPVGYLKPGQRRRPGGTPSRTVRVGAPDTRRLIGFTRTGQDFGTLRVGNLQRVVKVLRLPVERSALPPFLDDVLGGQFCREDPASQRARDLLLDPSADARQVFSREWTM